MWNKYTVVSAALVNDDLSKDLCMIKDAIVAAILDCPKNYNSEKDRATRPEIERKMVATSA